MEKYRQNKKMQWTKNVETVEYWTYTASLSIWIASQKGKGFVRFDLAFAWWFRGFSNTESHGWFESYAFIEAFVFINQTKWPKTWDERRGGFSPWLGINSGHSKFFHPFSRSSFVLAALQWKHALQGFSNALEWQKRFFFINLSWIEPNCMLVPLEAWN